MSAKHQPLQHHLVACKAGQASAVRGPVSGRIGGNAPIVVQIYALGRGIAIEAKRSNLVHAEGSFELEAFGKFFLFDVAGAVQAQGLVASVQGKVAPVRLSLKAIGQKDVAELKHHGCCSPKTVIVSMPPATGKTTLAEKMALHFGCTAIVEEWCTRKPLTPGALHLTNEEIGGAA